jgi:hypothetical protein
VEDTLLNLRKLEDLSELPGTITAHGAALGSARNAVSYPHQVGAQERAKNINHPALGQAIMDSAKFHQVKIQWHIILFLLMPDHVHAVLSFSPDKSMSEVIRNWKRFHIRVNHVIWQEGYFDHRLRP